MEQVLIPMIVIVVICVFLFAIAYNSLIGKRNQIDNTFAAIDVQLKKRYDLIPNLVASVKTYMKHENQTLTQLAALRSQAMKPNLSPNEQVDLNNKIQGSLRQIMVQVEQYPDLKASENFQFLMRSLNEVEEQLSAVRRSFNASVTDYNTSIQCFPTNILANAFGFTKRDLLVTPEAERANVNVGKLFE